MHSGAGQGARAALPHRFPAVGVQGKKGTTVGLACRISSRGSSWMKLYLVDFG